MIQNMKNKNKLNEKNLNIVLSNMVGIISFINLLFTKDSHKYLNGSLLGFTY
jgi:hypothetical protein